MPYNLKHRETGQLFINPINSQPQEWESIKDAAQWVIHQGKSADIFNWEAVEVVKPLPIIPGLYVSDKDGNRDNIPVNLYSLSWHGVWGVLGPEGWIVREPNTIPRGLVRLVPENS